MPHDITRGLQAAIACRALRHAARVFGSPGYASAEDPADSAAGATKYIPGGGKPEDARTGLPTGRYRFEYSNTFVDHYPEQQQAIWTGSIVAEPIVFEIADNI
jgi:hypothetical protein